MTPTLLVISQTYVPDAPAVGQYMHDAAVEMARQGWRVVVLTSARGYDDPTLKFPAREVRQGVEIVRLPLSSFGKRTILIRLLGQMMFLLQAWVRGLCTRNLRCILVSTSPPMASLAALGIRLLRRTPIKFWLMDLNPDQAVALGKVRAGSVPVRCFDWLNRRLYGSASDIVVLDRFMRERVLAKRSDVVKKITILPPWPLEAGLEPVAHEANPFRAKHQLQGKFVFMYSGNMSVASPLTTILQAALRLRDDPRLMFVFIGGGLGKKEVEEVIAREKPSNMLCLPYQPLAELRYSLSAADVHWVTLGDNMVGMIHPCKVYGAMAVARPVLYVGPEPSHLSELVREGGIGWRGAHGDVAGLAALMREIAGLPGEELARRGELGRGLVQGELSRAVLAGKFVQVLGR